MPLASLRTQSLRTLSSDKTKQKPEGDSSAGGNATDANELVLSPGEKVVVASRLTMWTGVAVVATCCAYFIGKELIPTYVIVTLF